MWMCVCGCGCVCGCAHVVNTMYRYLISWYLAVGLCISCNLLLKMFLPKTLQITIISQHGIKETDSIQICGPY